MPETEEPKYPEILPVIKEYLEKQQANGEPMRIHFWDTNHHTDEPHQVFADKSLHDLAKKYGAPLYAVETLDVTDIKRIIPNSLSDIKGKKAFNEIFKNGVEKIDHEIARLASIGEIIKYKMYDEFTVSDKPTNIVLPDPREKDLKAQITKQESNLLDREKIFLQEMSNELITNKENPKFNLQNFMQSVQNKHNELFSENDKEILGSVKKKATVIVFVNDSLDTSEMDKKIADNINAVFNHKSDVQLTLYGAAHFTKQNDLNERMEGLSIAIVNSNHQSFKAIKKIYLESPYKEIHNQFPDYVYYANEKRIIKMDNDAAKAEFLGLNEEQFNAWKVSKGLNEQIKLKYDNIAGNEMPIPQAHLLPPKIGNKQPSMNA